MRIGVNAVYLRKENLGIYSHILNLFSALLKLDKENDYFFYLAKEADVSNISEWLPGNLISTPLSWKKPIRRVVAEQFFFPYRLRKDRIDLYHSPFFHMPMTLKTPTMITVHDLRFLKYPKTYSFKRYHFLRFAVPLSLKKAKRIIAVSQNTKDDIVNLLGIEREKICVIYNGVRDIYRPENDKKLLDEAVKKFNLPKRFFLCVGGIEPRKNIDVLVQAFKILKDKKDIDHGLVIVGPKGWQYGQILKKIRGLGISDKIIFTGFVEERYMPLLYNLADIFVYPSLYEGFGIPVIEAMACGTPVVTSNCSSLPEVAGDAAVLVDPKSPESICNAMVTILESNELREKLVKKGFERIKLFSWERNARKLIEEYRLLT